MQCFCQNMVKFKWSKMYKMTWAKYVSWIINWHYCTYTKWNKIRKDTNPWEIRKFKLDYSASCEIYRLKIPTIGIFVSQSKKIILFRTGWIIEIWLEHSIVSFRKCCTSSRYFVKNWAPKIHNFSMRDSAKITVILTKKRKQKAVQDRFLIRECV